MHKRYGTVCIRRDNGLVVKPESESIDGKRYQFRFMWDLEDDHSRYPGEQAWSAVDWDQWPKDAPSWIASGDIRFE